METRKNADGSLSYKEKVYLNNGKTITKTFSRKTDAISWKRNAESEKIKNAMLGTQALKENLNFEGIFHLWMERKIIPAKSYNTIADYRSIGQTHLLPFVGTVKIRSIERSHGTQLLQILKSKGLANRTVNKILIEFNQIVSFAELEGYISKSPLRNFTMLKLNPGRVDYLSNQEILQLLRAISKEDIYPLLVVALNTGMRIGELTGLCWDGINFETDTAEVSRTLGRGGLKDTTKTNLVRYIPMNVEVKTIFQRLMRFQRSAKFVFANSSGKPFNPDHYSQREFQKSLEFAGVRKVNFHVLRHTYASEFMMNGGNIYDLQKILGHTKVDMTMKYAHLSPHHLRKVVETVRFSAEGNQSVSPFIAPRENKEPMLSLV